MTPVVRVVGLGPGDADLLTRRTFDLLARVARRATANSRAPRGGRRSSTSRATTTSTSSADSFDALYEAIATDLIELATNAPGGEVALRRARLARRRRANRRALVGVGRGHDGLEPAVSVIDVACAALGRDPMASGLRIVDALVDVEPLRGPGPLLVLQTYSSAVLASVADRLPPATRRRRCCTTSDFRTSRSSDCRRAELASFARRRPPDVAVDRRTAHGR